MVKLTFVALFCIPLTLYAALLDKVTAVIDDKIVTLSEVRRIQANYPAREQMASLVYKKGANSVEGVLDSIVKIYVIRKKLSELGITIDDESVESRIDQIEKSQGVSRDFLVSYLKSKNVTYKEYFELIKQMMEISYFNSKIISPLVSVSEQEVKNYYGDQTSNRSTSYRYEVTNYNLPSSIKNLYEDSTIIETIKRGNTNGSMPPDFADIQKNDLSLESQNLNQKINKILAKTSPKNFSKPAIINERVHVFYIKSKKITNSTSFKKEKQLLTQQLMMKKSQETIEKWIASERDNYFIKYFL